MKSILFGFLFSCSASAFCQQPGAFAEELKRFDLEYNTPKGYREVDTSFAIVNGKTGHLTARAKFALKSGDGRILIAVTFQGPIDTNQRNVFKKPDGTMWDPNKNYIPSHDPYTAWSSEFSKKAYNADAAGTWDLTPGEKIPVLNRDEKCKVIVFHKENKVDVELYYYYRDITPDQLNKHLKRTSRMLRFKAAGKNN